MELEHEFKKDIENIQAIPILTKPSGSDLYHR